MNKFTAFLGASLLLGSAAQAQTYLINENFEGSGAPAGWTPWVQGGGVTANFDQAAPAFRPSNAPSTGNVSSGEVLQLDIAGDGSNGGFYIEVTLTENRLYQVDAATAATNDPTSNWEEIFITPTQPVNGIDVTPGPDTILVGKNSSWVCEDWDNTLLTSCDFGGMRTFTAPSTGTFYVVFKSGVCCGGGPATVILDEFTIEDVGAAEVFDAPPTPLSDDFEDMDLVNNYGGTYRTFGGGDPGGGFATQDEKIGASIGAGNGGGSGLLVKTNADLEGLNFVYYGLVIPFNQNENASVDISGFNSLRFDARLGASMNPTSSWTIRFEDNTNAPANNQWNYVRFGDQLTTSWQTFVFPLSQWADGNADGGLAAPDLMTTKNAVFVSEDGVNSGLINVDLEIDNLVLSADSNVTDWQMFD